MKPTQVFEVMGSRSPYFTVLTDRRNRDGPGPDFWESGKQHATLLLAASGIPTPLWAVLEYGVGVGRIIRAMPACKRFGVDVSQHMLEIAAVNVDNFRGYTPEDWKDHLPYVELAYSFATFQHIPEAEGLRVLEQMIVSSNVCTVHVVVGDRRPPWVKALWRLSFIRPFAGLSNLMRRRPWSEPRIPMFVWGRTRLMILAAKHERLLSVTNGSFEGGWESHIFTFKRL